MREEFSDSEVRKGKGQAKKSNNILEIINSSEEEEEDDKIFFEMYKYYQASWSNIFIIWMFTCSPTFLQLSNCFL